MKVPAPRGESTGPISVQGDHSLGPTGLLEPPDLTGPQGHGLGDRACRGRLETVLPAWLEL